MSFDFSSYRDRPVFVTGSSGFSGGHLTSRLLELGANVTLLVRSKSIEQVKQFRDRGAKVVEGDLRDRQVIFDAITDQKVVFHVGALFREAKHADQVYFDVNLKGSINLFDASEKQGLSRVVHCSTNGVHGTIENPPGNEDSPLKPGDVYQESKLQTELEIGRYSSCYDLGGGRSTFPENVQGRIEKAFPNYRDW
jgi:nucleoside-diphosphate-sugar epimerase